MEITYARHPDAAPGTPAIASRFGDLVFAGGHLAADGSLRVPDELKPVPDYIWASSMERQIPFIYRNLTAALDELGSGILQVAKINSYHVEVPEIHLALRMRKEIFGVESPPPSTVVTIDETMVPTATVVLDVTAVAVDAALPREPIIETKSAFTPHRTIFGWPVFIQAVRAAGLVFTAGVASVHRKGQGLGPDDETKLDPLSPYSKNLMKVQTELIIEELGLILQTAGCSLADVVKADIYLRDASHLAVLDEVWASFFPDNPPARTITPLPLAKHRPNKFLEVELIAVDPKGPHTKETISTPAAPQPLGPQPQAVRAGPYLFLSTQMATDFEHGVAPEARIDPNFPFHASSIKRQVEYIYENVEAICAAAGTSPANILKRRAAYLDLTDVVLAEEVWQSHLHDRIPPTTTIRCKDPLLVPGCSVQYDLTVAIP